MIRGTACLLVYCNKQIVATAISAPYNSLSTFILNAALLAPVPVVAAASTDNAAGFCISQMSVQEVYSARQPGY